jgi:hypothetical protein
MSGLVFRLHQHGEQLNAVDYWAEGNGVPDALRKLTTRRAITGRQVYPIAPIFLICLSTRAQARHRLPV